MNRDYSFTITLNPATILTYIAIWWLFGFLCGLIECSINWRKHPQAWSRRRLLTVTLRLIYIAPLAPLALAELIFHDARKKARKHDHQ